MVTTQPLSRRLKTRSLIAAAACLLAAGAPLVCSPSATAAAPASGRNAATVTFEDQFDGAAGAAPDATKWTHEVNGDGGGNSELQYYTDSTDNAALDGQGDLVITARQENPAGYQCWYGTCDYTSARLNTASSFTGQYGHFEARIKIPSGQGIWPAFWMLGDDLGTAGWPNCGEIDVMENIGSEPGTVHGSLHGPGYSGGSPITGSYSLPGGAAFADDFHTFAVDWSPEQISWSVDGVVYQTKTPADAGGNPWVFDHPFFLILNVAVGGTWPGSPDGSSPFPKQMIIDYVRVDQRRLTQPARSRATP